MNYTYSYDQPAKTVRRRRIISALYLVLFGVMIGVVLMKVAAPGRETALPPGDEGMSTVSMTSPGTAPGTEGTSSAAFGFGGDYRDFESAVIEATRKAMPAVVTVHVTGTVQYRIRDPFLEFFYGPQIRRQNIANIGSGVIIDPDGTIITNDHVVSVQSLPGLKINVELPDGRTFDATVKYNYPAVDIAILQIEGDNLPYLPIGSSEQVQPGQTVLAIGNPFGTVLTGGLLGSEPTVTRGIISAKRRNLTITDGQITRYYRNMLQTDAAINRGNSGGALIDLEGNLIGLNTAIYSPNQNEGSVGIGFAIPSDRIRLMLNQIEEDGKVGSTYSGLTIQNLTAEIADAVNYPDSGGVLVSSIESSSPGEVSGLHRGDIIVKVNGFTVTGAQEMRDLFYGSLPGEKFQLTIYRDGRTIDMEIEMGSSD